MSSLAKSAWATLLQRFNGVTYDTVQEVSNITGPSQKAKAIDVTNMDSPSAFAEYIAGIVDGGTIQAEGNWTAGAIQVDVLNDFQGRVVQQWKILLPGTQPAAGYWTFTGMVTDFDQDFKVSDRITYKFTIQITGKPVFATV